MAMPAPRLGSCNHQQCNVRAAVATVNIEDRDFRLAYAGGTAKAGQHGFVPYLAVSRGSFKLHLTANVALIALQSRK